MEINENEDTAEANVKAEKTAKSDEAEKTEKTDKKPSDVPAPAPQSPSPLPPLPPPPPPPPPASQEIKTEAEPHAEIPPIPVAEIKRGTRTSQRLKSVHLDNIRFSAKDKSNVNLLIPPPPSTNTNGTPTSIFDRKSIRARRNTITDCVQSLTFRGDKNTFVPFVSKKNDKTRTKNETTASATATPRPAATARTSVSTSKSDTEDNSDSSKSLLADRLNCSVSLERLTGIIDNLVMNKTNDGDELMATGTNKMLCLYCERSFSSQKLHLKHMERVHHSPSGRRLSARNTVAAGSATVYAGCSYCNVGKITCLPVEELLPLLQHLVEEHGDKYFACNDCVVRFANEDALINHMDDVHNDGDTRTMRKVSNFGKRRLKGLSCSDLRSITTPLEVQVDFDTDLNAMDDSQSSEDPSSMRSRLRRTNMQNNKMSMLRKHGGDTILSRLGLAQNRSPRMISTKNRRGGTGTGTGGSSGGGGGGASSNSGDIIEPYRSETPSSSRSSRSNKSSRSATVTTNNAEPNEFTANKTIVNGKPEPIVSTFDEDFYESVTGNVKKNLSCHLDGKLESGPSPMSPVEAVPAVRSILVKSPLIADSEIHEATTISAVTAFPTLLTEQQYGVDPLLTGKMKKPITRHSWKWRWDCVKKFKYVNEGGKIVKKLKQPMAGSRDLSKLDMWTQLTMRTKHELMFRQENNLTGEDSQLPVAEAAREEKRRVIEQLNKILDTRVLPQINLEQNDQSIIKQEKLDDANIGNVRALMPVEADTNFPTMLNLIKLERTNPRPHIVLSGEWARPRCYICFGCGDKFATVRSLEEHKVNKHPYVHSTHYEVVGKELIEVNLLQNFYIPSNAIQCHEQHNNKQLALANMAEDSMDSETSYTTISMSKSESIDMDSNSRNSKVSVSSASSTTRSSTDYSSEEVANKKQCSKCNKNCSGNLELYRHMLDCSSDYIWILAKKRQNIKYRYFGTKRRRVHRPNKGFRKMPRPKKEENSDASSQKSKEPTPRPPRPSDGMLLDFDLILQFVVFFFYHISLFSNSSVDFHS